MRCIAAGESTHGPGVKDPEESHGLLLALRALSGPAWPSLAATALFRRLQHRLQGQRLCFFGPFGSGLYCDAWQCCKQASSSEDLHGFVAECLVAPSKKLQALRAKAANGETTSFSWFQSPTADEDHSYMFLSDNKQPSRCSPYCQWQNISFPVQFHFRSRHAKDVAMYDDKEKPVLILPNLAFKVVRGDHRPLLCHVHSRAGEVAQRDAPLPQLAIQEGRAKLWPIPPPSAGSAGSQDGRDPWMCSEGLR